MQQEVKTEKAPEVYKRILDLPLRKFIDCSVNENLLALIISGTPSQEELKQAWTIILQEYSTFLGDGESKMYLELMKEVALLDLDYKMIQIMVQALSTVHIKYMADDLNELINYHPRFKFDPKDMVQYNKDLDRCLNRSKSILINYQLKKTQLDALNDKNANNAKPTEEYYYEILYTLEDHAGHTLGDNITVHQFVTRIKKYNTSHKNKEAK